MKLFASRPSVKLEDGARLEIDGLVVRLTVSSRARRVSLRIDPLKREVIAIAPSTRRLADAWSFARERRDWAVERLAALPPPTRLLRDGHIRIFDHPHRLIPDGRRPRVLPASDELPARILGCGEGSVDQALVARAIRREALTVFTRQAAVHSAALGVTAPQVATADARTRWGSCSPPRPGRVGAIRLSWRLALAPFVVADYVVAHECAHLIEANHGPEFWRLVGRLVDDVAECRTWLRSNGASLQGFGG